jgi:hypothetical protein
MDFLKVHVLYTELYESEAVRYIKELGRIGVMGVEDAEDAKEAGKANKVRKADDAGEVQKAAEINQKLGEQKKQYQGQTN